MAFCVRCALMVRVVRRDEVLETLGALANVSAVKTMNKQIRLSVKRLLLAAMR